EHGATAAGEQIILGRKSAVGQRVRVPWDLADIVGRHRRTISEGFRRDHDMTGRLIGGRGAQLALNPAMRQICRAQSHRDREEDDTDIVASHCLASSRLVSTPAVLNDKKTSPSTALDR